MKSEKAGKDISQTEITNISNFGIWLYVKGTEYFLPFVEYPWFKEAKLGEIMSVELLHNHHLRWEKLDIDLELDTLPDPDKYPLIYIN